MAKSKPISEEDFSAWKDNAITQAVMLYLKGKEDEAHRYWVGYLTGDNNIDPVAVLVWRAELRAKLELMQDIRELELSDIQEAEEDTNVSQNDREIRAGSGRLQSRVSHR